MIVVGQKRLFSGVASGFRCRPESRRSRPEVRFHADYVSLTPDSGRSRDHGWTSAAEPTAEVEAHQFVTRYTEGFSHFVTSMTDRIRSEWNDGRVGLAPTGKAPP